MVIDISQQQHDTTRNNDESVHFLTAMGKFGAKQAKIIEKAKKTYI